MIWEVFNDSPGTLITVSTAAESPDVGSVGVLAGVSTGLLSSDCTLDNSSETELDVSLIVHAGKSSNPQNKKNRLVILFTFISIFTSHAAISTESI